MARVRHYFSYDEALAEWRKLGLPEYFIDRRRLLGSVIVIEDEIEQKEAEDLVALVKSKGGDAHLCRRSSRPKVIMAGQPMFYDMLSMDTQNAMVGGIVSAVRNYHSEHVPDLPVGRHHLRFDRPLVMGILNLTPDSFSDGGSFIDPETATMRAFQMSDEGADTIDIGAESTRPGAAPVSPEVEWDRLRPVLEAVVPSIKKIVSVDTRHPEVAEKALELGVHIINDISGLRDDRMATTVAQYDAAIVAMHMRGEPSDMQSDLRYEDLMGEIFVSLKGSIQKALDAGIKEDRIVIDPGIGFSKSAEQNLEIIRRLRELRSLGRPILIGTSRKRFIGEVLGGEPKHRLEGSLTTAVISMMNGASIIRVHDVAETVKALKMAHAVMGQKNRPY